MRPGFGTLPVISAQQPVARALALAGGSARSPADRECRRRRAPRGILPRCAAATARRGLQVWVAASEVSSPGLAYQLARSQPLYGLNCAPSAAIRSWIGDSFWSRPAGQAWLGKMHGIFVAVDFHALGDAIVRVGAKLVKRRGSQDHMSHSVCALRHPFGQHLAGAAGLADAEGEDAGLEGIRHAGHRPDQRVAVRRIGDRPVDHLATDRRCRGSARARWRR